MPAGYQRGPWRWPPVARVGENFERRKSGCDRWGPILPDVTTAVAGVSDGTIGTATQPLFTNPPRRRMGQGRRPPGCGERRQAPVTSAVDATVGPGRRKFRLALPAPPGDARADGWAAPFPGSAVPPPSAPRGATIGAKRNLMRLSPRTRFAAVAFALVLICVFGARCAEDASPTTPALPDPPAPPPTAAPPAPAPHPGGRGGRPRDPEALRGGGSARGLDQHR